MVMMEEFRRRKNLERYYELMKNQKKAEANKVGEKHNIVDLDDESITHETAQKGTGPERFFLPGKDEIYKPSDFTLIFIDSDSVTNVTALNRVNHRRVLLFIGNGNGVISYGMGKSDDYEKAFENAFKTLKKNLTCISLDQMWTVPRMIEARHNDFRIKIYPQAKPNYWGNPMIWKMLVHTGFFHCRYVCKSRKRDPYALVYGFFKAVTQNSTIAECAEVQGEKLVQLQFGNPAKRGNNMYLDDM